MPDFDFRDMLGGADAKLSPDLDDQAEREWCCEAERAVGEGAIASLESAARLARYLFSAEPSLEGVVGYLMARVYGVALEKGVGPTVLQRWRVLLDMLEAGK